MTALLTRALLAASLCLIPVGAALADDGRAMPIIVPPAYTQECASCHAAYPPGMLSARSWNPTEWLDDAKITRAFSRRAAS